MEKQTKICPHCGGEVLAVAKKCKHCHNWFTDGQTAEDTPIKTNEELLQDYYDNNKTVWIVTAAVVVLVIITAILLFDGKAVWIFIDAMVVLVIITAILLCNGNSQSSNEFFDEAE